MELSVFSGNSMKAKMGILIVLRSIVFIICFSPVYVGGDRLESTEFPQFWQRKLREHNCTELYSVYNTEVERIQTKLKEYGQTYDIVVLNFTVNLDCIRGWVRKFCHRCYNFVNRHDKLLYYTLIERATLLLYYDAKRMHEINKYFKIDVLKDTWGKTNDTFS